MFGSRSSNRTVTNAGVAQFTEEGALLLANLTASALPPLPDSFRSSRRAHAARNTSLAPASKSQPLFYGPNNVSGQDQDRRARTATATLRWVPHATVLRNHGPAVEVHVACARSRLVPDFTPMNTGLTLCASVQKHQLLRAVQVSDLVRFGRSGSHEAVIFTVAASYFRGLLFSNKTTSVNGETDNGSTAGLREAGQTRMEMWVARGQCMVEGGGHPGTWSLGRVNLASVLGVGQQN